MFTSWPPPKRKTACPSYAQYFNYSYDRIGTLWEGRYKATLIDSDTYLLTCMRYVELNPVRAGTVDHPGAYPWSSYQANVHGAAQELLTSTRFIAVSVARTAHAKPPTGNSSGRT